MLAACAHKHVVREVARAALTARDGGDRHLVRRHPVESVDVADAARVLELDLVLARVRGKGADHGRDVVGVGYGGDEREERAGHDDECPSLHPNLLFSS